jgi:hypothetical protein
MQTVEQYKTWYESIYSKPPSEKLIASFCKSNNINVTQKQQAAKDVIILKEIGIKI